MRDLLADLESGLPLWEAVADSQRDWERIFTGAQSTLDWPSARYWRELMEFYPETKVILSVRDTEVWVQSMRETVWGVFHGDSVIHHVCEVRAVLDQAWRRFMSLMRRITWEPETGALAGDTLTDEGLGEAMERWNDAVKSTVPPERLLVWDPREGYEPLCGFLEVEAPAEPLPRINDTASFREGIIGDALKTLNDWWDQRERPETGLHGAALPEAGSAA
jgi:hypothetical protein